jgi:hypothetical protein
MSDLSDKILALATLYLGPAAKVFLERQTRSHMNGLAYADLKKENLPEFSKWVFISASLLIEQDKARELSEKILGL